MVVQRIEKATITLLTGLFAGLISFGAFAQLPELGNPVAASGQPTTARFFGGATADSGASFLDTYSPEDALDILGEIHVEASHVGSIGDLYVVGFIGPLLIMQVEDGSFVVWEEGGALLPRAASVPLAAQEPLTIIQGLPFGALGITDETIYFFLAYTTQQQPGELYFSGVPITVTIAEPAADAFQLYQDTISQPIIQGTCIQCHVAGEQAQGTRLVYQFSSEEDYLQTNFETLSNFILNTPGGSQAILSKPLGIAHGGGPQLAENSAEYVALTEFVAAVLAGGGGGDDEQALFDGVDMLDSEETLRKAALLFAGRLPTADEISTLDGGGDGALREAIRDLMSDEGFENFLIEGANDHLLTLAYSRNIFAIVDRYYYPNSRQYFQQRNFIGSDARQTSEALALEPLKLIAHVVSNERPYTEVLTADYIMVNPWSAQVYGGDVQFSDINDPNEWREGRITEYYRCTICTRNGEASYPNYSISTDYPHAGILNSPAFLARFPSTSTNRNRARARWAYYFFLGVDIEGLSERTQDPDALADENNPTLNNPNCTVCHDIMDPVAGAFQNYGDDGYYRDRFQGRDALPGSYKNDPQGLYQRGDTWYADMLAPGFKDLLAPDPDNSLQWLAQQFAADERFGRGTVNFWFPAVIGREPLAEPENPEDVNYSTMLAAYSAEQQLMQTLAADFVAGARGNGAHNLKDLLVDLAMSGYFRARSSDSLDYAREIQLTDVGYGQLLTPEQLNRKLQETTGYSWDYGRFNSLTDVYGLIYGGIDSLGVTERARDLTTMMSTVVVTMANETACPMVAQDFGRAQAQRRLFPLVGLNSLPTTHAGAIRSNIQYLHERLLGENLPINDPEIDATFNLFNDTWLARIDAGQGPDISSDTELCLLENAVNPVTSDPNQTLRSWAVVINYLLRDYRFIHE